MKHARLTLILGLSIVAGYFTFAKVTPAVAGYVTRLVVMGDLFVGGQTASGANASITKAGALTVASVTSSGAVSGTTGAFSGKVTVSDAAEVNGDADEVQLIVQSHSTQTSNLVELQASDGSTDAYIADNGVFSMAQLSVSGTAAVGGKLTVSDAAEINGDSDEVQLVIQSHSTQTSNLVEGQASDGSTDWYIADNGVFSIASLATSGALDVAGNSTFDGTVALGDAAADTITVNGDVACQASLVPSGQASDPCATLDVGSVFYNSTNSIMCYCNVNGDDLKIDGSSASCF